MNAPRAWLTAAGLAASLMLGGACKGDPEPAAPSAGAEAPSAESPSAPAPEPAVIELEADDPAAAAGAVQPGGTPPMPGAAMDPAGVDAAAWTPEREAQWQTELAQVHLRFGKHPEALALLEEALPKLKGTPLERQVHEAMAATYRAMARPQDAVRSMEQALAVAGDDMSRAMLQQQLAALYAAAGDTEKAEAAWQKRLAEAGSAWERDEALRQIIDLRTKAGTLDAWVAALEEKLDKDADDGQALNALYQFARQDSAGGTGKRAAELGLRLVKLTPDDLDLKRQVREQLRLSGQFDDALRLARELAAGPHEGMNAGRKFEDQRQVAEILLAKGDRKDAISALESLAADASADGWVRGEARRRLFEVYRESGELADVVARYERELSNSKDRDKLETLLSAYEAAGMFEPRVGVLTKLRDLAPDDDEVQRRLSQAWVQARRWDEAGAFLTEKLRKAPEDQKIPILQELASVYSQARQPDKAKAYLQELILRDPDSKGMYQGQLEMLERAAPDGEPAAMPGAGGPPPMPGVPPAMGAPPAMGTPPPMGTPQPPARPAPAPAAPKPAATPSNPW
ncbi:MAG: tetratricopeptide repeat protein [Myxococcota bacterium]